ncbi:hypothetical protein P1X14_09725 [Sphingomonas sp. AOB5]|uniref:hypothetical protein n=1 Tax=Sphingomonas sp. AOB5 TaxID=3034017 RepID=UPI0023F84FA3|nr:hypothetical protein [Sphingomonas sp. AOB5]MDF7775524.1 hypothetical protein [Sphingomonas sp. AOB5]
MSQRIDHALALEARAAAASSLAEAQSLQHAANRLRSGGGHGEFYLRWARLPLFRN